MNKKLIAAAAAAAALTAAAPAAAATFVFSGNAATSGGVGNSYSTSAGGIGVTATAWSGSTATATPAQAYLGRYGSGLGVTNVNEGAGGGNSHVTDNVGSFDFVALTFSQAVNLTGITRNGFAVGGNRAADTDAWISFGEFNPSASVASQFPGFVSRGFEVASGAGFSTTGSATTWLIGASRLATDRDDGFKLGAVTAVVPVVGAVPEPATWMSMILGFGVVGGVMRRRTRVNFAIA